MTSTGGPVTTLTLFGFDGLAQAWALAQMALARRAVGRSGGLRFWKLLGSGRGLGFSIRPDLSRYGLLAVWANGHSARAFLEDSAVVRAYRRHAAEMWTAWLRPLRSHGSWDGADPFATANEALREAAALQGRPIAVLTRATIRVAALPSFWSSVPAASRALESADGLLASTGIGEAPFVRQATFSVWRDERAVMSFAYGKGGAHRDILRRTRAEGWYTEELFARFAPIASSGSWHGRDPLAGLL